MFKTLMLGNVIAQVVAPVATVAIHTTPMDMTRKEIIARREELEWVMHKLIGSSTPLATEIANAIPSDMIERNLGHLSQNSSKSELAEAQNNLFKEFASKTSPAWNGMSRQSQVFASTLSTLMTNDSYLQSAEYLQNHLWNMGHEDEASEIFNLVDDFRKQTYPFLDSLRYKDFQLTDSQLHNILYSNKQDRQSIIETINNGKYSLWSDVYNSIHNNIYDLTNGVNSIPGLDDSINHLVKFGKVAALSGLTNMQAYQKTIMWVSSAFTLLLSIGAFIALARIIKNKSSRKSEILFTILAIILLIVTAALVAIPFIGGK